MLTVRGTYGRCGARTYTEGLDFYRHARGKPRRIGVLAGSFNPPTVAHLELARAASREVDVIVYVVPRAFPHKEYSGATLEQRIEMLDATDMELPHAIAVTSAGLYIDIARECQEYFGASAQISLICGRDAAERILTWDYGRPGVVDELLCEFELLVAPRGGHFAPPEQYRNRIHALNVASGHEEVSSTEVRERIAQGAEWEDLVPEKIREQVREIYS
jgi:nicotinate (nicotinamide) nucleotide adenylyltransferase